MQVTVKGKQFDVTDPLRNYASDKIQKITRYFDHMVSADVTLTTERNWHIAQITVFGEGFDMRGEERSTDMYNSIDRVIDKLEQQAKKQKAKSSHHRGHRAEQIRVSSSPSKPKAEVDPYAPKIDKTVSFPAEECSLEEAVKRFEATGFPFFAFLNIDNDRINILSKSDKGYKLIDPRIG